VSDRTKVSDYSKAALAKLPTLRVGHTDDLKLESETERVWLSRMTKADGAGQDHQVTISRKREDGTWS
jgi:hypothetical protein